MKHYRVKELPVKGVCKQQCCGMGHHECFPQEQLSGPCGQRGASPTLKGRGKQWRPRCLQAHSITSNSQSSCSLCEQHGFVSKHWFASAFSQSSPGSE